VLNAAATRQRFQRLGKALHAVPDLQLGGGGVAQQQRALPDGLNAVRREWLGGYAMVRCLARRGAVDHCCLPCRAALRRKDGAQPARHVHARRRWLNLQQAA